MDLVVTYKNNSKEAVFLMEKDSILIELFNQTKEITVTLSKDYFKSLVQTIISQQLSTKVADVIFKRLGALLNNHINPLEILDIEDEELRTIGLSRPKIKYVKSLAFHMENKDLSFDQFDNMTNQEIIDQLIKVKGIGIWTAQMFLMFSMGRQDVFSTLDLGLRNALKKLLDKPNMTDEEIKEYSHKWKPYRTIVSHYLWYAID